MDDRLIEELVIEVAGEDVVPLIQLILGKKDVNEFKIAEKLDITVNKVRNMLYRLSNHNLVDFIRKKDKRKGWYIYYWTFDLLKAHNLILITKRKKVAFMKQRIEKEKRDVYLKCVNGCVRFDTINAMEYDFRCPECGELLVKEDADKIVASLKKQIIQAEIDIAEEEKRIFKKPRVKKVKKKVKKKKKPKKKKFKKKVKKKKKFKKKVKRKAKKKKPKKKKFKKKVKKRKPKKKKKKVKKRKPKKKKKKVKKRKPKKKFKKKVKRKAKKKKFKSKKKFKKKPKKKVRKFFKRFRKKKRK